MREAAAQGAVVTFYSYKGGTGRSMALANVACLLAERASPAKPILMIDWDLEAPGLHRFLQGRLWRRTSANHYSQSHIDVYPGLIEIFRKLDSIIALERAEDLNAAEQQASEALDQLDLDEYLLNTSMRSLQLIKAGAFDSGYATRINSFDWDGFYARSPFLFALFAQKLAARFSYVLIDSRTGLTDTSGICTALMPEKLVVVFTPNRQSLAGVTGLVRQALEYRRRSEDERPLLVYPLPSRIESNREDLRRDWRYGNPTKQIEGYQPQFEELFKEGYALSECNLEPYFNDVQIQQSQDYAYGEEIAALSEKHEDRFSLKRSYKTFLEWVETGTKPWERARTETVPIAEVLELESKARAAELESKALVAELTAQRSQSTFKVILAGALGLLGAAIIVALFWHETDSSIDHWIESVAISPDAQYVAACRWDGQLLVWHIRADTGSAESITLPGNPRCSRVYFGQENDSLAIMEYSGVSVWRLGTTTVESPTIYEVRLSKGALSADGTRLVTADYNNEISFLDLKAQVLSARPLVPPQGSSVYDLAISGDGESVAAGTSVGVQLWRHANSDAQPIPVTGPHHAAFNVGISPDGRMLAACISGQATVWRIEKLSEPRQLLSSFCDAIAFSPDNEVLAVNQSSSIALFSLEGVSSRLDAENEARSESQTVQLHAHSDTVTALAFSADGSKLVSGGQDGKVFVWSALEPSAPPRELLFAQAEGAGSSRP